MYLELSGVLVSQMMHVHSTEHTPPIRPSVLL